MSRLAAIRTAGMTVRKQVPREAPWLLGVLLLVVVAALVQVGRHHWRMGVSLIGVVLVVAGLLRAALPARVLGLLAARSRAFDTLLLIAAGVALIALVFSVPTPTG